MADKLTATRTDSQGLVVHYDVAYYDGQGYRRSAWRRIHGEFRLLALVTRGDKHVRYSWYLALSRGRAPWWLRFVKPKMPTTNAPWLNSDALAYRRGIGMKEPFLG